MGDYHELSEWAQCDHKDPQKKKTEGSESEEDKWQWKQRCEGYGAMSHGVQVAPGMWKREGNEFCPGASGREGSSADTLILALTHFGLLTYRTVK